MPKGNHDMSEHASIERACHDAVHEQISKDIAELYQRLDSLAGIMMAMHPHLMDDFKAYLKERKEEESDS